MKSNATIIHSTYCTAVTYETELGTNYKGTPVFVLLLVVQGFEFKVKRESIE